MLPHVYPIDFPLNPSLDLPGPPHVRHAPCGLSRGLPAAVRSPSLSLRQRDRGGHAAGCAPIGFNNLSASFSQAQLALLAVRSPGLCTRWSLCWGWFPLNLHSPSTFPERTLILFRIDGPLRQHTAHELAPSPAFGASLIGLSQSCGPPVPLPGIGSGGAMERGSPKEGSPGVLPGNSVFLWMPCHV